MKYQIVEWNTENVIEEFGSNEEREKWVLENCYPSQDMSRFYWIMGDIRIEFRDTY